MGFFIRLFFCGIIVSGLGLWFMRAVEFSDLYNVVHKNVPGPCKFVQGVDLGAEDISVLPNGLAIMSTGLMVPTESGGKPALKSFDFSKPEQPARDLTLSGFKGDLMPHGLSLYSTNGKTFVYVVNHPAGLLNGTGEEEVLKFLWQTDKQTLVFQKSFKDPEFRSLNDLVVVGDDKFYVTNWFTMKSPIMRQLEAILFVLPLQNVVYFDGKAGTVVLSGKYGANGINASPDKKYLYLMEVNKKRITSYRIESPLNLVSVDEKNLGSLCDNLDVDPESGDIWTGCHPVGFRIMGKMMFNPKASAPSQVIRVGVKNGKFGGSTEVFADDGSVLSASTVAVPYKDALLIGTLDHKALHCKLTGLNPVLKL